MSGESRIDRIPADRHEENTKIMMTVKSVHQTLNQFDGFVVHFHRSKPDKRKQGETRLVRCAIINRTSERTKITQVNIQDVGMHFLGESCHNAICNTEQVVDEKDRGIWH